MVAPSVLVAGPGTTEPPGFVDGVYTDARFHTPIGMIMDAEGYTAYICDYGNDAIRVLDIRTRAVTTYAAGPPLDKPIHIAMARSGNLYVSCASNGDRLAPIVKITTGGSMSIVGQAHQPRGLAVNTDETAIYNMEQGHMFFSEIWMGGRAEMTMGGVITDKDELGRFNHAEGGCLAPDGYFYGVCAGHYFYSSGAGFKRFTPGGNAVWHESGAPPAQSYSVFSSPSGGEYGTDRRCLAVRSGSDGRMWFYSTTPGGAIYLTKLNLGATGGIHSEEHLGSVGGSWGIALSRQDAVYVSSSGLYNIAFTIQGSTNVTFYGGVGSGLNSIYYIGCPPQETVEASDQSMRLIVDDGTVTVRSQIKGSPKVAIAEDRDRCGRPLPAEMSNQITRLRVREQ